MNGHIGLIHSIVPATVDLQVTIPESHPSARNLGAERVGSGTIIDPSGYILTVHYVTIGAASIAVTLPDGEEYPGKVVAQDQESGLSLVKIPGRDLPFLKRSGARLSGSSAMPRSGPRSNLILPLARTSVFRQFASR